MMDGTDVSNDYDIDLNTKSITSLVDVINVFTLYIITTCVIAINVVWLEALSLISDMINIHDRSFCFYVLYVNIIIIIIHKNYGILPCHKVI